jgi:hypothetical protein
MAMYANETLEAAETLEADEDDETLEADEDDEQEDEDDEQEADKSEPLTYSVPEAGRMVNPPLSKNASYEAARRREIPTLRFGHLLRVPGKRWRRMLAEGR